ncbi:hypothetical protein JXA32_04420 [Candidatus Sumerlaeota bacterium]|nr:hypothetical protein [Candidatus Sumerlaeota bacterium]
MSPWSAAAMPPPWRRGMNADATGRKRHTSRRKHGLRTPKNRTVRNISSSFPLSPSCNNAPILIITAAPPEESI